MAQLPITKFGDPILRTKMKRIEDVADAMLLVEDMFDTMYEELGMGLSANQVGHDLCLAIMDISHADEHEYPRIFINPEILESWGRYDMEEGCLSIPEIRGTISRPEKIRVRYMDETGETREEIHNGLLARVIQHEVDHLNGVFYIDHLSPAKRALIEKRLQEIASSGSPSSGIVV
jgi:peptide deformylase